MVIGNGFFSDTEAQALDEMRRRSGCRVERVPFPTIGNIAYYVSETGDLYGMQTIQGRRLTRTRKVQTNKGGKAARMSSAPHREAYFPLQVLTYCTFTLHRWQPDVELEFVNGDPNALRIKAMKDLTAAGFMTWASIEPVIDFNSSFRMIQQALDAGCQHFKIGLMTEHTKVCRSGFTLGGKTFEPYDPARCLAFVQDVMTATRDRATVYWKQSFRDFIGGTGKHRLFTDDELHKIFDDYPHAVGKDWSFFK